MYLLRFFLYGLLFFGATSYWAFEPYPPSEAVVKYVAGHATLGGVSFVIAAYSAKLLVLFYRELLEHKDE